MSSILEYIVQSLSDDESFDITAFSAHLSRDKQAATFTFTSLSLLISVSGKLLATNLVDIHGKIHRNVLDPLRQQIRFTANAANGGNVPKNPEAFAFVVLEALEIIHHFELEEEQARPGSSNEVTPKALKGWRADEDFDYNSYIDNPLGLDVSSVADTAFYLLKKTPEELCRDIDDSWRIIHVESILRRDIAKRFERHRKKIETSLRCEDLDTLRHSMPPFSKLAEGRILSTLRKEDIIEDMLTPRVTYHGTPLRNVSSIVRHGFKLPGSKLDNEHSKIVASPRSGIVWNRGIYSSQAPFYALSYASYGKQATPLGDVPTLRLFICATVMGQTLTQSKQHGYDLIHGPRVEGYDSHFDGSYELIVHDAAAIVPCYVVHLDMGAEAAKQAIFDAQKDPFGFAQMQRKKQLHPKLVEQAPGDSARLAVQKKAAALKWFPNGFGPAKGTNFVIEAIAPVDDDEEEYGDWQAERHGFYQSDLNQYQGDRRT